MISHEFIDYADWVAYLAKNNSELSLDGIQVAAKRLTDAGHFGLSRTLEKDEYLQRLKELYQACNV